MPKISIIVPVYKAEALLPDCIDSILSQTFSDFEVFLVNDGSPDNCGAICDGYAARDARIRVIHQENQGQAAARNHAIAQAAGQWLCFVDSDDVIHPQMVQLLYEAATAVGGISMCLMLEAVTLPDDFERPRELRYEVFSMDDDTLAALHDREEYPAWVACAKLIPAELVKAHLFHEGRVYEDNEAVCHWVCGAKTLARIPEELYFYRTNPGSTTQRSFSLKKLDYLWALEQIIRFYHGLGYEKMKQRFADRYAQEAVSVSNGLRFVLEQPEKISQIEKRIRRFSRELGLRFTTEQKEQLLDAMHPKVIRLYWPVAGAVRTLKSDGISGGIRKLKKMLKGESGE